MIKPSLCIMWVSQVFGQASHTLPMSLLHTLLLHRQTYAPATFAGLHHWSPVDSAAALDQLRTILTLCQRHRGIAEMCVQIYGGHCVDVQDRKAVEALTEALILPLKDILKVNLLVITKSTFYILSTYLNFVTEHRAV